MGLATAGKINGASGGIRTPCDKLKINPDMIRAKYRGYSICQQKEFGPLKLLKWVEGGDFIIVKDDANAMPGATFRTVDDAKKAIDLFIETFRALGTLATKC